MSDTRTDRRSWTELISAETVLFTVGVLLAAGSGFLICSRLVSMDSAVVQYIIATVVSFWMALSNPGRKFEQIIESWFISLVLFIPIAFIVLSANTILRDGVFLLVLIVWSGSLSRSALPIVEGDAWDRLVAAVSAISVFSSAILSLGQVSYIPYAQGVLDKLSTIASVPDIRSIMMALAGITVFATAVFRARREGEVKLGQLGAWQIAGLGKKANLWSPLFISFTILINGILLVLFMIFKIAATLWEYLVRVGKHVLVICRDVLLNFDFFRLLVKAVSLFFLEALIAKLVGLSVSPLESYLRSSELSSQLEDFALLLAIALLMELCILIFIWIIDEDLLAATNLSIWALVVLLTVFLMSGLILLGLAQMEVLQISGFDAVGPFTVAMMIPVAFGLIKAMIHGRLRFVHTQAENLGRPD